jgi:hypothetical protein
MSNRKTCVYRDAEDRVLIAHISPPQQALEDVNVHLAKVMADAQQNINFQQTKLNGAEPRRGSFDTCTVGISMGGGQQVSVQFCTFTYIY